MGLADWLIVTRETLNAPAILLGVVVDRADLEDARRDVVRAPAPLAIVIVTLGRCQPTAEAEHK